MKWYFSRKQPSDKTRDPIASEFFASDAIKDAGEALVREGIQNSLDARLDINGGCQIRIYVSAEQGAVDAPKHVRWFDSAWPHFRAPKNGLKAEAISPDRKCRYLVFEDFETTGLTGDTEQYDPTDGHKNAFFYFFRAEGKTEKSGDDRGRWGIGKQVFPRASRAQAFFGYSETMEGPILMGGCILKHHNVQGVCYKPDGYFGLQKQVDEDTLTIPIKDPEVIEQFRSDFRLTRKSGQTGLSIVVPWLDDGDEEERGNQGFERNALSIAAISGYFIPILEGRLEVVVEDHVGSHRINRETYRDVLLQIETTGDERLKGEVKKFLAYLEVAEIANKSRSRDFVLPACNTTKAEWAPEMLSEALAQEMREALAAGAIVRVKASLTVRPKDGVATEDSFVCVVSKKEGFFEKPCHIREDLIIPNVTRSKIKGFVCLVRVNRGALATLLGDSENPSHTEWQTDSKNFKGKYTYGGVVIEFVSEFANELVKRIQATSRQLDRTLLVDLFYDESIEQTEPAPKPKATIPEVIEVPVVPENLEVSQIRISDTQDGFSLGSAGTPYPKGTKIAVRVAYETSKGDPLKAYKVYDFNLASTAITTKATGCRIMTKSDNHVVIEIQEPKFLLHLSGFDINRDLVVRAKVEKDELAAEELITTANK